MSWINPDECGWVIPLKIDDIGGEAILSTNKDRIEWEKELLEGLEIIFREVLMLPETMEKKAFKSIEKISRENSPEDYAVKLLEIYSKKINSHRRMD